jgi:hypothetical protein
MDMNTTHEQTQRAMDSGKDLSSAAFEKAHQVSEVSRGLFDQSSGYVQATCAQLRDTTKHCWHKFPPFRWATYTLTAFNAIPIAILIFWAIVIFGFVSLPVVGVFLFVAFIVAGCALLAWGGFQASVAVLTKLGLA